MTWISSENILWRILTYDLPACHLYMYTNNRRIAPSIMREIFVLIRLKSWWKFTAYMHIGFEAMQIKGEN